MKDWEKQFDEKFGQHLPKDGFFFAHNIKTFIRLLLKQQENFFKETGKQGGLTRKKQNPDYSAMGKKGMAKRWKT